MWSSSALEALAASGGGRLCFVDDGMVGLSDLDRRVLCAEAVIDRPKVDLAVERLRWLNTDIRITGAPSSRPTPTCWPVRGRAPRARQHSGLANRAGVEARRPWVVGGHHGLLVTAAATHSERRPVHGHDRVAGALFTPADQHGRHRPCGGRPSVRAPTGRRTP